VADSINVNNFVQHSSRPRHSGPDLPCRLLRGLSLLLVLGLTTLGCGLRTIPPIRYIPIFGKEAEVKTTDVLVRALRDRDVAVRAEAVELLGLLATAPENDTRREVAAILGEALGDRDPGLRLQVVEVLGRMEPEFANKHLNRALRDPNPFVREKVLEVLDAREKLRLQPAPITTQAAVE
jgi:hypothetical protein